MRAKICAHAFAKYDAQCRYAAMQVWSRLNVQKMAQGHLWTERVLLPALKLTTNRISEQMEHDPIPMSTS